MEPTLGRNMLTGFRGSRCERERGKVGLFVLMAYVPWLQSYVCLLVNYFSSLESKSVRNFQFGLEGVPDKKAEVECFPN